MAMARDRDDVRRRLGAITIGTTYDGDPVTAEQLEVAGAMAVLLKDALKPNLVQTLEGQPALVHAGPFANIAHGNSSLVADLVGLKLADYVVTEGGFGSDLGFEKFVHIVCRAGGLTPAAVVLIATTRALKRHGGDPDGGLPALERGAENLAAHLRIVKALGFDAVVAVNRFPDDTQAGARRRRDARRRAWRVRHRRQRRLRAGRRRRGGACGGGRGGGCGECARPASCTSSRTRSRRSSMRSHGSSTAAKASSCPPRRAQTLDRMPAPLHRLPVCVAKTHLSLSHDPELIGAPRDFVLPVRELRRVHRSGLDRGGLRRDTDDARPAVALRGREDGPRRRRPNHRLDLSQLERDAAITRATHAQASSAMTTSLATHHWQIASMTAIWT